MSNMRSIRCVLMGFSLDETVLSTVIDGFHRSHRYQVVSDAVACRRPGVGDAASLPVYPFRDDGLPLADHP